MKITLHLEIEFEENSNNLIACGIEDLKTYFIPQWMGITPEEIKELFMVPSDLYTTYLMAKLSERLRKKK